MANAKEIVEKFQAALGQKDFAAARKFLDDNLAFQGPIDTFDRADNYIEAVKGLSAIIQRIDVKRIFSDGNDVCLLYDMVTNTPAGTAFIAEWYQIKGDKIGALRVVFDARPFANLRPK